MSVLKFLKQLLTIRRLTSKTFNLTMRLIDPDTAKAVTIESLNFSLKFSGLVDHMEVEITPPTEADW